MTMLPAMETRFVEASNGLNWGKFLVGRFEAEEWALRSQVDDRGLIYGRGWTPEHVIVWDLQTGEGSIFAPHGSAAADLNKHRIWVCPLFEPFLIWLYDQDLTVLQELPSYIALPDTPGALFGYRRPGPNPEEGTYDL